MKKLKKASVLLLLGIAFFATAVTVLGGSYTTNQIYGNTRTRGAHASGATYNEAYAKVGNSYDYKHYRNAAVYCQAMGNKNSAHTAWTNLIWGP